MELIRNYEKAVKSIAKQFIKQYFSDCDVNIHWIDGIRRVVQINDYFFDIEFMIHALKLKATEQEVFDYYDESLENVEKFFPSFENWIKYRKSFGAENINTIRLFYEGTRGT